MFSPVPMTPGCRIIGKLPGSWASRVLDARHVVQAEQLDCVFAHFRLADLASDGHRKPVDYMDVAVDLVVRQVTGAEFLIRSAVGCSAPGCITIQTISSSPYSWSETVGGTRLC